MEAALGFMAARLSELVGAEAAGQLKGWAGILGRRAVGARRDPRRDVRASVARAGSGGRGRPWRVGPGRQRGRGRRERGADKWGPGVGERGRGHGDAALARRGGNGPCALRWALAVCWLGRLGRWASGPAGGSGRVR
jgi:hypothetical protein